ncbi:MAG TPA: DUF2723 domain-containing protein [Vicinamibacterales bacterium]|nr:DUF2723 domain-containing protein [Vicinamibacterales bacterium]
MTTTEPAPPARVMRRWQYALLLALPPALVYSLTMAPGVIARGDVPKFQYLGAILGTAHSPGYPLYIELSWLFSQLPLGSIAWRVNMMTMLFGVSAAMTTAWAARECGAGRAAALVAAWGLAFGAVFWEQATAAEVYTLAITLHSAVLALAIRWRRTRRDRDLLGAVAVAALALGHHPTFAMTVPALVVFVLAVDWRTALRPRIVTLTIAIVALGLAQYGYIFLRTAQGAAFLEVRAASLADLISALRGDQYETSFNAFTGAELVADRLPLLGGVVLNELTIAGSLLATIGIAWLATRAWRTALLLALTGAIVFGFTLTYDVPDYPVFMTPLFAAAWIAAAVGLDAVARLVRPARARTMVTAATAATLAATMVARGYAGHDLSRDTADRDYLAAMFEQVRLPVTFVFDRDGPLSHAVRYKLLADRAALRRARITHVDTPAQPRHHLDPNRGVYAFEEARALLEMRGILMSPVWLTASLADRPLPRGATLAVAMSAEAMGRLLPEDLEFLQHAGAVALRPGVAQVMLLRDGAVVGQKSGAAVDLSGASPLAPDRQLEVAADASTARVAYGPEVLESTAAVLFAVDNEGRPIWSDAVDRSRGMGPLHVPQLPLYRAVGEAACADAIGTDWARFDDPSVFTTRISEWMPRRPRTPQGVTIIAASDDGPVRLAGHTSSGEDVDVTTSTFDRDVAAERSAIDAMLAEARLTLPGRFVTRFDHALQETRVAYGAAAVFALWPRPIAVAARAVTGTPLRVCLPPVRGVVAFGDGSEARVELIRASIDSVGAGWHEAEGSGVDLVRWTAAARAEARVSLAEAPALRVVVQAGPQPVRAGDTISVEINGHVLPAQPLGEGQRVYSWNVPEGRFRVGYNSIVLLGPVTEPGADGRALGLGVRALSIERMAR